MKRSTCKMLIGVGIILAIVAFLTGKSTGGVFIFSVPSLVLFIIALTKWNSEKEKRRR